MNSKLLEKVEKDYMKNHPDFNVGDTVEIDTVIRDGDKTRTQVFRGLVIAIKGSGTRKMFTVRKISSGIGVEKILPLYSPNVDKIKIVKKGDVRRAKLYYMRDRVGKLAMKAGDGVIGQDDMTETQTPSLEKDTQEEVSEDAKSDEKEEKQVEKPKEESENKEDEEKEKKETPVKEEKSKVKEEKKEENKK